MPQIMKRSLYFTRVSSKDEGIKLKNLVIKAFGISSEDITVEPLKPEHRVIIDRTLWLKKQKGKLPKNAKSKLSTFSDCEWGVFFVHSFNPVDKAQAIVRKAELIVGYPLMDPKKKEDTIEVLSGFIAIKKTAQKLSECLQ
jgi:hypothetical protein